MPANVADFACCFANFVCCVSCQDVADLAEACEDELQESKGSARLGRRVDAMISKLDLALHSLETQDNVTLNEMREDRYGVGR